MKKHPSLNSRSQFSLLIAIELCLVATIQAQNGNDNPTGITGVFNGNSMSGCSYDPYTANATRTIPDITVAGAVGSYPLQWARTMNSRGGGPYFGGGGGWRHSYQWGCSANEQPSSATPVAYTISYPDGRVVTFASASPAYKGPIGVGDRFQSVSGTGYCYLLLADGGKVRFHQTATYASEDQLWYFTFSGPDQISDPHGLVTALSYDTSNRLNKVTEPAGRWLDIAYTGATLVLSVTARYAGAPSGGTQSVSYGYSTYGGYTVLVSATYSDYVPGTYEDTATYTYQNSNVSPTGIPLISTCRDPRYPGPMKNIKYAFKAGGFYGQLSQEQSYVGTPVVTLTINSTNQRTETRGDGPVRVFTYAGSAGDTSIPYLLSSYTDFYTPAVTTPHITNLTYDINGFVNWKSDFNQHITTYSHIAATGALTRVTHLADGSHIDYAYEDPTTGYYLKSVTDELLHTTTYQHSDTNKMTLSEVDYPDGGVESFTYNSYNERLTHTMVSNANGTTGGTETFAYDTGGRGLLVTYAPPAGTNGSTTYSYDANDHVANIKDGRNNLTLLFHDQVGRLTVIQYPEGSLIGYVYNPDGTLQYQNVQYGPDVHTDIAQTSYTYDDYKRVLTVSDPMIHITHYWYDKAGMGTADLTHTDSNVTQVVLPPVDSTNRITQTLYDENGHKTSIIGGYLSGSDAKTTFTYDGMGNLKTVKDPKAQIWTYSYDARDRLINVTDPLSTDRNSLGHTVDYTYDVASNKKSERRANDQLTTYDTYDPMNRLTQQTIDQGITPDAVTKYTWTKAGKLGAFTDPLLKTYQYDYDTLNRLTKITYPVATGDSTGKTEVYAYDLAGNLHTFTNRAGSIQTFTYDSRNRETNYSWNSGNPQPRTVVYDNASRMTQCNTTNTFVNFTYYNDNRLKSQEEWGTGSYGDGVHRTISYAYNADGLRNSVTYPGMAVPSFTYDYTARNQLQDMISKQDNNHVVDYAYDVNDLVTSRSLQNGTSSIYAFDAVNRVKNIYYTFNANAGNLSYGYDAMGNRTYVQRGDGSTDGFTYDKNNQLLGFRRDGILSGGVVTGGTLTSYSFDAAGNWITAGGNKYSVGNLNDYLTAEGLTVSYGLNRDVTTLFGLGYTYDSMNRLGTISSGGTTQASFYYDGLGRQVARNELLGGVATITYSVWDEWNLFAEYNSAGTQTNRWIRAGEDLIRRYGTQYGAVYFYPDANGSTRYVSDDSGNILERYTYDAYGTPTFYDSTGAKRSPNITLYGINDLFTGQRWYPSLGLYDLRNRAYVPRLGRFLQPDPIGFKGDAANLYRYCGNNPATLADPNGTGAVPAGAGLWGYVVPPGVNYNSLTGNVIRPVDASLRDYECAANGQVLSGGNVTGEWHDAPKTSTWIKGPPADSSMPIGTLVATNWGANGYNDNPNHHTLWVTAFYPDGSADLQSAIPVGDADHHYYITAPEHYTAEQLQSYYRVLSKMKYDPIASQGYLREPDLNGMSVYRAQPVPGYDDLHPGQGPEDVSIGGYTIYSAGDNPFAFDSIPSTYIGDTAGGGGPSWGRSSGFLVR